jgi:cation-transporting ATPase 13A3/4/5
MTLFLINVLIQWYPTILLYIYYSRSSLEKATHVGIYCSKESDTEFEVVKLNQITLPKIYSDNKNSIIKNFNINLPSYKNILMFDYKLFSYIFNPNTNQFESLSYHIYETYNDFLKKFSVGLYENEVQFMRMIFGQCILNVELNSIFDFLWEELERPERLFEILSFAIWFYSEYNLSYIIFVFTIISTVINVYEEKRLFDLIKEISVYTCEVNVYRKGKKDEIIPKKINSAELVPGDLYEIPEDGMSLPCDTILINGSVIVNESLITGDDSPVVKNGMNGSDNIFDTKSNSYEKYLLFAGTKIIEKRSLKKQKILGVVYETGFKSLKGKLIGSILNPKYELTKFEKDSMKYIFIMLILTIISFLIPLSKLIYTLDTKNIILFFLDNLTTAIPISLAGCVKICITHSLARLKSLEIYSISRETMNSLGSVNLIVLDKTGTLTEENVEMKGYLPVKYNQTNNKFEFSNYMKEVVNCSKTIVSHYKKKINVPNYKNIDNDLKQLYIECLATCHNVTLVKGELIGDPIDRKMLEGVGWILRENFDDNKNGDKAYDPLVQAYVRPKTEKKMEIPITNIEGLDEDDLISFNIDINKLKLYYELSIIRRFNFNYLRQRLTVLVKNLHDNYFKIFSKGSPEKILEICDKKTIPSDYNEVYTYYSSKGYRILGMAYKHIKLNMRQILQIKREHIEKDLIFIGFAIIENKLKEGTKDTIVELDNADYRMVMASGDNLLTCISVAKECSLVREYQEIFSCEIENNAEGNEVLKWNRINYGSNDKLDDAFAFLKREKNSRFRRKRRKKNANLRKKKLKQKLALIQASNINDNNNLEKKLENNNMELNEKNNMEKSNEIINDKSMNNKNTKFHKRLSSKNLTVIEQQSDKNLIIVNPQLSSKNLLKVNIINSISLLDLYPIQEPKVQRRKIPRKKQTDSIPLGLLSKDSITISKKISIDNNNSPLKLCKNEHFAIATTGATFEKLHILNEKFISEKDMSLLNIHRTFRLILKNGIIFTRMAPDHKALLIESFKKEQMSTLMCGDGTNDCPALRKADVGVALSSEEASMASHFNYTKQDISCLFHLLKEGKCALSASMQTFKFMIMYSVLCYIAAIFLMYHSSNVSDMQGFFLDLFLIYPLEWFVSQTDPTDELTYERPIGSLFSFPIILSLLGQIIIGVIFQYGGYYYLKYKFMWEELCEVGEEGDPEPCPENTIIYIINQFQLIFSAITLYKSKPFRRSILTNKMLMLYLAAGIIFTIYITIFNNERIKYAFDLFDFEIYEEESKNNEEIDKKNNKRVDKQYYMINYYLLVISTINAIVNLLFEWVFVEYVNNIWWEKKNKECKELIKIEKKKGIEMPYNINNEIAIREYINIYYHERRNKMKDKIKENGDLYFIEDEDDVIELDDMTPGGQILNK